ncbi:MAG: hypothetical protein J6112_09280 [Clostridia bacterium]|nr:hypothetical protein [Clostridia bacterium]
MRRETISTFSGRILGYYEIDSDGSKTIRDVSNRILGYYDAGRNVTMLINRSVFARGDVSGFFFSDEISF